jgi:hypothetical protein
MTLELVSAQATTDDPDAGRCSGTTIITGAPLARPHHESAARRRGKTDDRKWPSLGGSGALGHGQGWRMRSSPRCRTAIAPARLSSSAMLARSPIAAVTVAADWSARRKITMPE